MLRPRPHFAKGRSAQALVGDLRRLGLAMGTTVLVHASLRAVGPVAGGADTLLEALQVAIGESGTVMVPAFCWEAADPAQFREPPPPGELEAARAAVIPYTPDAPIDPDLGVFPRVLQRVPGARRSMVPASFLALGRQADELAAAQDLERPYGRGGPLGKLGELNGWVLLLGVGFRCATSVHYAEDQVDLPYLRCDPPNRYLIGPNQWLVASRDYGCSEGFDVVQEVLRDRGQLREGSVGNAPSLLARHNHIAEAGLSLLAEDRSALLCGRQQCAWCSRARRMLDEAQGR